MQDGSLTKKNTKYQEAIENNCYDRGIQGGESMGWIVGMQRAINYVEEHLKERLDYEEIAKQADCSSYYFQKIFGILCDMSLGEYIRNRRLSLAGSELVGTDKKVIDIALEYGYESPESFTRAFVKFHGVTPTQARTGEAGLKIFSRIHVEITMKGGNLMENYKIVEKEAFKVLEKVETHSISREANKNTIPDFWGRAHKDGTVETLIKQTDDRTFIYGICYGNTLEDSQTFEYAIAAKYTQGAEIPEGFRVNEIPARTWLVFDCTGPMPQAIQETFHRIITEFFPSSEYEPTFEFDIEAYPAGPMTTADYKSQVWIPIKNA